MTSEGCSRTEFVALMADLAVKTGAIRRDGKGEVIPDIPKPILQAYWSALGDVPFPILQVGFAIVANSATWHGLPPVGKIRSACVDAACGVAETPAQAWQAVRAVLGRASQYHSRADYRAILATLPGPALEVAEQIGIFDLQQMPSGQARATFMRSYSEHLLTRKQQLALPGRWPKALTAPAPERAKAIKGPA